jgi:hypothetical protein
MQLTMAAGASPKRDRTNGRCTHLLTVAKGFERVVNPESQVRCVRMPRKTYPKYSLDRGPFGVIVHFVI